ncbi:MAG: isoleucine--tRNA ligase [Candidatus Woesearchaeota archaeon]
MIPNYDFKEIEPEILKFWEKHKILEKARKKSEKGKDFYFLDGPPYTSGQIHIGTAWNKSIKDSILRFKRASGLNVYDRAGYDMHGLPIEHAVDKKLKLKDKEDIIKFGVDKYVKECKTLALTNLKKMNEEFIRLGVWMDFENAYQTISEDYINGEWWLIKKAHENNRLYEGFRTMTWCASCETALAKHELEYKNVKEESIFLKFKVKGTSNEYLIIWTTTPWTIPYNMAVMVNPELDYVRAKVEDEIWIIAKQLVAPLVRSVADKDYETIEEFKGKNLEGMKYEHPLYADISYFQEIKDNPKLHSVIMSEEYVDTSAGSGLVHCAPGCGPEDYEVGYREGLPPFNSLNEKGEFPDSMGRFSSLVAKKDDKMFIQALKDNGSLIETTDVDHDYAHCWRCHNPVIFRATKQWFFKVEDLKDSMIKANNQVAWVPKSAYNAFNSWLENLRDNSITKQRFWGCPLPVWRCEACKKYDVIGSIEELETLSGKKPKDFHKPWIDEITIPCICRKQKTRIPDILDVWVDAGTASWNDLNYPKDQELFNRLFPADFILEGKDQIRGWFNLLMVASMVAMDKPSFKAVYMHGFVQDAQGRKMSKSQGNYISPEEVISEYGADSFRYFSIANSLPAIDLNYNFDDIKLKLKHLGILWNVHKFVIDMAKNLNLNPKEIKKSDLDLKLEEKYIISKLNSTIARSTEAYDNYLLNDPPKYIEELFLELSRTYIQFVRDKSNLGNEKDKKTILWTIYKVLLETLKIFTPTAPFICEKIYHNLKHEFRLEEESISLYDWPEADKNLIDEELEEQITILNSITQGILYAREKIQMGVRWPLKKAIIVSEKPQVKEVIEKLGDIIKKQTNIKELSIEKSIKGVKNIIQADFKKLGPDFGNKSPQIIVKLAQTSADDIINNLNKEGKFEIIINGEKISIVKEHIIVKRNIPENLQEVEFNQGFVYLDKTLTEELEAEGYSREIMRRTQALRKDAGLEKNDRIELFLKCDKDLSQMLAPFEKSIKDKVGASHLTISQGEPGVKFTHNSKEKVKAKEFEIFLSKI